MKRIILFFSLALLALTSSAQTTGTWNKVVAKDTLWLSGRSLAEIVYSIVPTSKNNESPTAKAVYDYVQSQMVIIPLPETEIAVGNASNQLSSSADFTYDGDFLHVVGDVDIEHENCAVVIDDIAPSGISQGGTLYLNSKDGAALANGDRIGALAFLGSTGVGSTSGGAQIEVFTDGAWSGTESPGMILFSTTLAGDLNLIPNMRVRQTGNWELLAGREFRYFDSDGSNYIGFKAPALTTNQTWTLPSDAPANGEVLTWTTGNLLTWETPAAGGTFYQTWKRDGTAATQRANANFLNTTDINITLADDAGNLETEASFDIPNGAIDLVEMANVSTSVLLGNANVAPGPPLEINTGSQFEINGVTLNLAQNSAASGDVYRWNGSIWAPSADGPGITLGSANQIFGVNAAGTANEYKTISGTTNRVSVTHGAGTITLSAPQDLHTGASPQFTSMSLINAGGSNVLTMSSAGSQTGISMDGVSPYIYAVDKAPSGSNAGMSITFYNNDGAANVAGDRLGVFYFDGRGGSVERTCAQFAAFAEETLTSTSSPGYMSILTTPTATTTPLERLRVAAGGSTQIRSANALRFYDSDNTNYIGFVAPALGSDVTLTWPSDAPTNGQQLTWNTGNTLSWEDAGSGGATDHGTLSGLGDDDHTQYFLLAGRSGGQIGTGGTGSGDDLVLRSTTNSTKGDVFINDQGGNTILGGGELSNELRFMEPAGSGANYTGFKSGAMGADQMYILPVDAPADGEVLGWNTGGQLAWDAVDTDPTDDATNDLTYVVMSNTAALSNERALSSGINSLRVDGGPNSSVSLDVLGGVSNVSQFTSDQDNYTNSDWSTRTTHTVSSDNGMRAMTGFTALTEGTVRRIINTGTFAMYAPAEHPDSDAANRVYGTTDQIIAPNGGVLEITYIGSRWHVTGNSFNEALLGFKYKGQFYSQMPGSTNQSDQSFIGLTTAGTGAGNQNNPPDDSPNLPQAWGLLTGTTATGSQTIYFPKNNNAFAAFGGGHLAAFGQIYVPTLSTSGQRYTAQISLTPSANGSTLAVNSSVGIRYSDNVNGGEWEVFTRNSGGTETTGDSNIAVAANTVYTCAIFVDKSLTEARFFITDGTNNYVTRIAATMPAATALAGVRVIGIASVGTTSKQVAVANIGGYFIQP